MLETLERILHTSITEDPEDYKRRMLALSKAELVEELLRVKVSNAEADQQGDGGDQNNGGNAGGWDNNADGDGFDNSYNAGDWDGGQGGNGGGGGGDAEGWSNDNNNQWDG